MTLSSVSIRSRDEFLGEEQADTDILTGRANRKVLYGDMIRSDGSYHDRTDRSRPGCIEGVSGGIRRFP